MIGIRFLLFADPMLVMGLAAFPLYALRRPDRQDARIVGGLTTSQPWLCGAGFIGWIRTTPHRLPMRTNQDRWFDNAVVEMVAGLVSNYSPINL